jgi:hypothetical protein
MKHSVWKLFINFEKEEKWLNTMAQKGMHMVSYTFCRYLFEEGAPGKYIYRLELLKELPGHPESTAYLKFMEESGVEVVDTYLRWVYFRKKASEGSFEIYTDREGKIKHAKRIISLVGILCALNLTVASYNLGLGLSDVMERHYFNAYFSILNFTVGALMIPIIISQCRIIIKQKRDMKIRE